MNKHSTFSYEQFCNEVSDPENIINEFRSEFQHRLRITEPQDHIKGYELLHNTLCDLQLQNCTVADSPDFTITESKAVLGELKGGICADSSGFIREMLSMGGLELFQSMLDMFDRIKKNKTFPSNKMYVQTIKKKNGSMNKLNSSRGIFLVAIISLIFEKLIKNRITPTLKQHMTSFQTRGVKGKGVVDNLFLLRGAIDHCRYLGGELWLTFYDIEKCFDSLWLEDCINSLYENGVKDDILDLIYRLNQRAEIVVRTPFGDTDSFVVNNLVRQGTVLGPILNNCSLDQICKEGKSYQNGNIQLKPLEFIDDIADPNDGYRQARKVTMSSVPSWSVKSLLLLQRNAKF